RIERRAVRRPRIAFVREQIDARGRPDRLVVVGLDVLQPRSVQHVIDVVGVAYGDETPSATTKPSDILTARAAQKALARVEADSEGLWRHRPGAKVLRGCRHISSVWGTRGVGNGSMGQRVGILGHPKWR